MKLKTLLLVPIVVIAATYGATKAYIYFSVKSELDNLVEMAAPFVDLSYGGISSDLRGKLVIEDVSLTALSGGETMQAQAVELRGKGPGFLIDLSNGFKGGEPPSTLSLSMKRMTVPVDQGFNASIGITGMGAAANAEPEPCTLGGIFRHQGLQEMGVEELVADAQLGYNFDQAIGEAAVFFDYQLDDTETFSVSLDLAGMPDPAAMAFGMMPSLGNFNLSYQLEPGYSKRMTEHCAGQKNQTRQAFIASLFELTDGQFVRQLGFVPGPGLRTALKTLVTEGGELSLSANPSADLDPSVLALYSPEDLVDSLGLEISLNQEPLQDISVSFPEAGSSPSWMPQLSALTQGVAGPEGQQQTEQRQSNVNRASKRRTRPKLRFQVTAVSELDQYVGSQVRLYSGNTSKPKQGFLMSLNDGLASVEQSVHKGTLTAHLRLRDIRKAEVLRRVELATATQ